MLVFRDPLFLGLIPVFLLILFISWRRKPEKGFLFPEGENLKGMKGTIRQWISCNLVWIRVAAVILSVIILARPQLQRESRIKKEGIAIMLAIDCSSTMVAEGIELSLQELAERESDIDQRNISRIDAAREVAEDFILTRPDDIIGIVAFAAEAFVVSPPTFDHEWLVSSLKRVKVGLIKDGTAIGSGILSCLNSINDVKAKTKIIILLTDGINNYGKISPVVAAKAARALGIKLYTIGIVSSGEGLVDAEDGSGRKVYKSGKVNLDDSQLKQISQLTGGKYFEAKNMETLKNSYAEIDKLEKTHIEQKSYEDRIDIFQKLIAVLILLLLSEIFLSNTFFRRIP